MKYKEKHAHRLRSAFSILALSMATLMPVGCTFKKEKVAEKHEVGLMDPTPYKTVDKYGDEVVLYHVSIPIYDRNGQRKEAMAVLTRGLKDSTYKPSETETYISKAYINGGKEPYYVKINKDRAVFTEGNNFAGLFLDDDNKVIVVADIMKFIKERENNRASQKIVEHTMNRQQDKPIAQILLQDSAQVLVQSIDSISKDTTAVKPNIINSTDTTNVSTALTDTNKTDSLIQRQKIRE